MRAGKKSEAVTGKTRPCIVYVKNLKESKATEKVSASTSVKFAKTVRNAAKIPIKRIQAEKDRLRESKLQLDLDQGTSRETRTKRRATSISSIELMSKRLVTPVSPRNRNSKGDALTVPRGVAKVATTTITQIKPLATPLTKRRNTTVTSPVAVVRSAITKRRDTTRNIDSEPKAKMYKQSKVSSTSAATPPPTIAASRSRRSIKPNPKYASDDMVTPKYVSSLASDLPNRRAGKHLFADDDEDDDLQDLIEEDNDDELTDAAFNPQLHKSDDDDDISEGEFEQPVVREKVPPKRGRGRPPKNPSAVAAAAQAGRGQTLASRGHTQTGRGGVSNLQMLRRTIAASTNLARSQMTAGSGVSVGNKRKLEDHTDSPIARKRVATEDVGRSAPAINGSSSIGRSTAIGTANAQNKSKMVASSNNNNSTSNIGMRVVQAPNTKQQRQVSNVKINTPMTRGGPGILRQNTAVRQVSGSGIKVQKAGVGAAAASGGKSRDNDDVPTFTIVNIDDIINQDDVLISRANNMNNNNNNSNKKPSAVARNNNNSNTRTNQMHSSSTTATSALHSSNSNNAANHLNAANRRVNKTQLTTIKSTLSVNHSKQTSQVVAVVQPKPRPRILNAEMGKKMQPMKPLMSMSKELCPMTDGGDTEDEDLALDLMDEDINISPTAPTATNQSRMVRRVQTAKWLPTRRNVLSATTTSTNASNNQQRQQHLIVGQDRKLTKLLGESSDDDVFKKPTSPSTSSATVSSALQQRRSKENAATASTIITDDGKSIATETDCKPPKYFPPETTTYVEEDGRIVKKITCYETWHVISPPKESPSKTRQQRTCLELPLVKLANVASRIKVPSTKWTSKVTLYKVSPSLMQRQTMTIFTGDLKSYNIPEEERHKYQPSCVLFRRSVIDRSKCRVPFDRAIIFKNKCFYANIEGKHVNLLGAPEVVNTVKDVEMLIDIVDTLPLSSNLVEMVTSK